MPIVKIKGGLGNQLFQYALGVFLSVKKNKKVKLDNGINTNRQDTYRKYILDKFNITLNLATKDEVLKNKNPFGLISKIIRTIKTKIFHIYNIGFIKNIENSKTKYFDGFWQSYKYTNPIRDILLEELTLKNPLKDISKKWEEKIKPSPISVSIHIRRGDYVDNPKTNKYHGICGIEYYKKAINLLENKIGENFEIFVFSDDIEWAKNNLSFNQQMNFVSSPEIPDYEEMYLMSLCKHNIIANSTFSWWGAWLNKNDNKIVIAPERWNNRYKKEYKDLIPQEWLKI